MIYIFFLRPNLDYLVISLVQQIGLTICINFMSLQLIHVTLGNYTFCQKIFNLESPEIYKNNSTWKHYFLSPLGPTFLFQVKADHIIRLSIQQQNFSRHSRDKTTKIFQSKHSRLSTRLVLGLVYHKTTNSLTQTI